MIRLERLAVVGRSLCVGALLWALLPTFPPRGYVLLRWLVFAAAAVTLLLAVRRRSVAWVWAFGVAAALYAPFWPRNLPRFDWQILDSVVGVGMLVSLYWLHRAQAVPAVDRQPAADDQGDALTRAWRRVVRPLLLISGVAWLSAAWVASYLIPLAHLDADSSWTIALPLGSEVADDADPEGEPIVEVRRAHPPTHTYAYVFWVGGLKYEGTGQGNCFTAAAESGSPRCYLVVDYDPHDPARNRITGDLKARGDAFTRGVILFALAWMALPASVRAITDGPASDSGAG